MYVVFGPRTLFAPAKEMYTAPLAQVPGFPMRLMYNKMALTGNAQSVPRLAHHIAMCDSLYHWSVCEEIKYPPYTSFGRGDAVAAY